MKHPHDLIDPFTTASYSGEVQSVRMTALSIQAFILTNEPRTERGVSSLVLYGTSIQGAVEIISDFHPYFFIDADAPTPKELLSQLSQFPPQYSESTFISLSGRRVRKVTFNSIHDAERARDFFRSTHVPVFESDVRPRERFMMDHEINGGVLIEGQAEKRGDLLRFVNPKLTPSKVSVPFRLCSIDIETSVSSGTVLSIAAHLTNGTISTQRVFMIGTESPVERLGLAFWQDERALLYAFLQWFIEVDPDIIIGWNVIGFDLTFLIDRADSLHLKLPLGRGRRPFHVTESTGRFSHANIPGRVVLDGPQVLRNSFYTFESYSLENVARTVLGHGKLIAPDSNRGKEIERLFQQDKLALAEYNLKDAVLVTEIFNKLALLDLTIKRSELSGMLLDHVGLSSASFDHFYLPRLHREGYVAPDISSIGEVTGAGGGYVMSPVAGLYDNIIGLDFQSLYPSIIRTFNIDPLSRACANEAPLSTPVGQSFSRTRAILPQFIGDLMEERKKAKKRNDTALSQAIKIMMNSFYGVMGAASCRFYHPSLPDAISSTGQWLLLQSKQWLEDRGHRVIYGDTDSLFVQLGVGKESSTRDFHFSGGALGEALTEHWKVRLKIEFNLTSYLSLEFKRHYKRFLVPSARGNQGGAKKRYAGLVTTEHGDEVEFVGLEVVRSDWTRLARDFQTELYTKIFKGEEIADWIRSFVAQVRSGKLDDKLVYRKRLHKNPDEYGSSPPPYVRAALMLPKFSRTVRYVMTLNGPVPVELKPINPDYHHYISRQIKPVADSILEVLHLSFDEIMSAQLKLFD